MLDRLKKFAGHFIRIAQKLILSVSLTLIYFLGFGLTYLFMRIFNPGVLKGPRVDSDTFWVPSEDCAADLKESLSQS